MFELINVYKTPRHSLPAAVMVTTMLVDVDELWSKTVTSTPIIIQQTGLFSSSLFVKALPAVRPDETWNVLWYIHVCTCNVISIFC